MEYMLHAYKASRAMEPIALLAHYVHILTYKADYYRRVDFYESIPPFQAINIGALAAQTVSARVSISAGGASSNFDLPRGEFAQWRWFPLDNMMVRLFNPAGVAKHQLKFLQVGIERSIIYRDPTLISTEFFSWEDERPAFEAMNFSDYALLATRIVAFGYRFHVHEIFKPNTKVVDQELIDKIKAGQIPCTPVQCAGLGA